MAALTIGATVAATALPSAAEARGHGGYGYYGGHGYHGGRGGHHQGNDAAAAAVFAGVTGLALGAALSNGYYGPGYGYGPGYYGGYGYAPGYYGYGAPYATCVTRHWAWDPYGRRVLVTTPYPC